MKIMFCLIFFLFALNAYAQQNDSTNDESKVDKTITADEFTDLMKGADEAELELKEFNALKSKYKITVLDVRSKESFAKKHIKDSINIPITDLTEKSLKAILPDKTKKIVIVCDYTFFPTRMMPMTLQAWPVLRANGYNNLYRLSIWKNGSDMIFQEEQEKLINFESTE